MQVGLLGVGKDGIPMRDTRELRLINRLSRMGLSFGMRVGKVVLARGLVCMGG